jgi:hypothetical protein
MAPPPRWAHGSGSSPAAHRPPAPPAPFANPGPATGAAPHPGHTVVPDVRSGRNAAPPRYAGAPAPQSARRPRPRRTQHPRSPCGDRHPAAHAITSHCTRRCPLLWFLTLDKPETLSDNDVRLLSPKTHPRNGHKSRIPVTLHIRSGRIRVGSHRLAVSARGDRSCGRWEVLTEVGRGGWPFAGLHFGAIAAPRFSWRLSRRTLELSRGSKAFANGSVSSARPSDVEWTAQASPETTGSLVRVW